MTRKKKKKKKKEQSLTRNFAKKSISILIKFKNRYKKKESHRRVKSIVPSLSQ